MPPLSTENKSCNQGDEPQEVNLRSSGLPADDCRSFQPPVTYPQEWPPGGKGAPCQCRKKLCQEEVTQPKMKYIQPEIPTSFKPDQKYKKPDYALESGTVYRLSYAGVDSDTMAKCKGPKARLPDHMQPSSFPFENNTTFRLSYTGVGGDRAKPFKPVQRSMMGAGPMQSVTTQRHDYTPKPFDFGPKLRTPTGNLNFSGAKMDGLTTMIASYQPVEVEKTPSFKPVAVYKPPDYNMENNTVNRLSYQPWTAGPKEVFPWAMKAQYQQPTNSMENNTIYRASYLNTECVERPEPFKPVTSTNTITDNKHFSQGTVYRDSYQPNCEGVCRPAPFKAVPSITPSSFPMSADTTFRLSYTGVGGEKAKSFKPATRNMMGSGPMQAVTTQRHDYTPKPMFVTENFKPKNLPLPDNYKMEDTTTFRASYQPNDQIPKTESFKPHATYRKPDYAFESNTVNRLSFQPWSPQPKEEFPWFKRVPYKQPQGMIDGTSIYRGSYLTPGTFIPDENAPPIQGGGPCECHHPGQCYATEDL